MTTRFGDQFSIAKNSERQRAVNILAEPAWMRFTNVVSGARPTPRSCHLNFDNLHTLRQNRDDNTGR